MALESNIRVVRPGSGLWIATRRAAVTGHHVTPDILQRACGSLRYGKGLAAVPAKTVRNTLLVATTRPVISERLEGADWAVDVADTGDEIRKLHLSDSDGPELVSQLIERALLVSLARSTSLWSFDSPRVWYEPKPFRTQEGIAAYRGYEVGALYLDDFGVGVAVDVRTAFFTAESLGHCVDPTVSPAERRRRDQLLWGLTARQQ